MNTLKRKGVILFFLACMASSCLIAACSSKNSTETADSNQACAAFSVRYGTYFTLPFDGIVKDSKGNKCTGSSFLASDPNGYTLTANNVEYKINVIAQTELELVAEYEDKYVAAGSETSFPSCTATGAIGETKTVYSLKKGESDFSFDEANKTFTPDETGEYVLTIKTTDSKNNTGAVTIAYHVVDENDDLLSAVAVFDSPTGVNHFTRIVGLLKPEFNEQMKFGAERGSTKLTVSGGDYFSQTFQMKNFYQTDISGYRGAYLYIYNDSNQTRDLWINWNLRYTLLPKQWNEVFIMGVNDNPDNKNEYYRDYITDENINGLDFAFNYSHAGGDTASFYFSNMYAEPILTPELITQRLQKLSAYSDDELLGARLANKVMSDYRTLSESERAKIEGYSEFVTRYANLAVPASARSENVGYAFGTEYGVNQITLKNTLAAYTTEKHYGSETGSTKFSLSAGSKPWTAYAQLNAPLMQEAKEAYFYVWVEGSATTYEASILNPVNQNSVYASTKTVLTKGAWTKVKIPATTEGLLGCSIQLNVKDWASELPADTVFYVSSLYFGTNLPQLLADAKNISDSELVGSETANEIFTIYRSLSETARTKVTGYSEFVTRYANLAVSASARSENVGYAFGTEYGVNQITLKNTLAAYTTEKHYGSETGSTKFSLSAGSKPWTAYAQLNAPLMQEAKEAYFYVWVEGSATTYEASILNPVNQNSVYASTKTVLTKGAWTKVKIPATTEGLLGCSIQLNVKDWASELPADTVFYVSSVCFGTENLSA